MLKYDISSDYVIYLVQKPLNTFPVCLNREEIKDFMINGHRFTYMNQFTDSDADGTKPGYYEILYDGKTRLIVRWEKAKEPNRFTLETEYLQETYFFLRMKGHYIYVRNQKSFIDSFAEYKKEIRTYMKKNNVRFSSGDHGPIIKLLEFYDNQNLK
jgi:hypothetical protein